MHSSFFFSTNISHLIINSSRIEKCFLRLIFRLFFYQMNVYFINFFDRKSINKFYLQNSFFLLLLLINESDNKEKKKQNIINRNVFIIFLFENFKVLFFYFSYFLE